MLNRRDFIKMSAYIAMALKAGLMSTNVLAQTAEKVINPSLKGRLFAATLNPFQIGLYPRDKYETTLATLDLETGKANYIPINMVGVHDALKVKDDYLVLPNYNNSSMRFTNLLGDGKDISLGENIRITGHGYFDQEQNVIIVCAKDIQKNEKSKFAIIDPDNHKLIDFLDIEGYNPHDIQLLNDDTFAVCNYNTKSYQNNTEVGFSDKLYEDHSYLSLYDRKTFKLKENILAYKNAMISHASITDNGDLYAVGFVEYFDPDVEKWQAEYIEDKFQSFIAENQPELVKQWPDIANSLKIHRIEKELKKFGLPLLPMKMAKGSSKLDTIPVEHFHHRRAQSICYVRQTNTVCMAFPLSNSILLYNATTNKTRSIEGAELKLEEMRGISEIEGTPYLAVAGIRHGVTIVDTTSYNNIQYYDVGLGRIIHMHYIA